MTVDTKALRAQVKVLDPDGDDIIGCIALSLCDALDEAREQAAVSEAIIAGAEAAIARLRLIEDGLRRDLANTLESRRMHDNSSAVGWTNIRAENATLRELVKRAEWCGHHEVPVCPWCRGGERGDVAHTRDCPAKPYIDGT